MLVGEPSSTAAVERSRVTRDDSLAELTAQAVMRASGEMADTLASGASARKGVRVQVPPRAQYLFRGPSRWGVFLSDPQLRDDRRV